MKDQSGRKGGPNPQNEVGKNLENRGNRGGGLRLPEVKSKTSNASRLNSSPRQSGQIRQSSHSTTHSLKEIHSKVLNGKVDTIGT